MGQIKGVCLSVCRVEDNTSKEISLCHQNFRADRPLEYVIRAADIKELVNVMVRNLLRMRAFPIMKLEFRELSKKNHGVN